MITQRALLARACRPALAQRCCLLTARLTTVSRSQISQLARISATPFHQQPRPFHTSNYPHARWQYDPSNPSTIPGSSLPPDESACALYPHIQTVQPLVNSYIHTTLPTTDPTTGIPNDTKEYVKNVKPSASTPTSCYTDFFPISLKDNFCMAATPTTAGSGMLRSFEPPYDSTVVERLHQAQMTIVGKTGMDEFGMGSFNTNTIFGRVINPWSYRNCRTKEEMHQLRESNSDEHLLSPGGSSGGAAAALASNTCLGSIGSDTGGSIRLPASYCGVFGLKPTYGRVSRYGLISYANSMDTPSIMAKTSANVRKILSQFARVVSSEQSCVRLGCVSQLLRFLLDVPCLLEAIEGFDPKDSTSIPNLPVTPSPSFDSSSLFSSTTSSNRVLEGVTIGIPQEYDLAELSPEVRAAWFEMAETLQRESGARVVACSLPNTRHALPAYYILAPAEAMSNLARYDGVRYGHSSAKYEAQEKLANPDTTKNLDPASRAQYEDLLAGPPIQSLQDYYTANRGIFGEEVQRRILLGSFVLSSRAYSSHFVKAQQIRTAVTKDFKDVFTPTDPTAPKIDFLLTPTAVSTALSFKEIAEQRKVNPVAPYLNDIFTIPSNLAGIPALSLPVALSPTNGLPIGLQLIGNYHSEGRLLDVASWIENWTKKQKRVFELPLFKNELITRLNEEWEPIPSSTIPPSSKILNVESILSQLKPNPLLFGLGVDIAHIPRFQGMYQRHGQQFMKKCLSPTELAQIEKLPTEQIGAFLASRWAIKEAMIKASGKRLLFPEMSVIRNTTTDPDSPSSSTTASLDPRAHLKVSGSVARWFQEQDLKPSPLISLSHDGEYAAAVVVIERNPPIGPPSTSGQKVVSSHSHQL